VNIRNVLIGYLLFAITATCSAQDAANSPNGASSDPCVPIQPLSIQQIASENPTLEAELPGWKRLTLDEKIQAIRTAEDNVSRTKRAACDKKTAASQNPASRPKLSDAYYACQNSEDGTTANVESCLSDELIRQKSRLKAQFEILSGKVQQKYTPSLKSAQNKWMQVRDETCNTKRTMAEPGRGAGSIYLSCMVNFTASRVLELESFFDDF
jgi:uncharacterized protein YecT (DUF1311 family)